MRDKFNDLFGITFITRWSNLDGDLIKASLYLLSEGLNYTKHLSFTIPVWMDLFQWESL